MVVVLAAQMEALEQTLFFLLLHQLAVVMAHGISKLEEAAVQGAALQGRLHREVLRVVREIRQALALAKEIVVELRVNILVQAAGAQVLLDNHLREEVQMEKVATGQHLL